MPTISDYNSLVAAVVAFSHRAPLGTYIDYLIQQAQEQIERDIPDLNIGDYIRFQESMYPAAQTDSTGSAPLPTDWIAPKFLTCTGANRTQTLLWKRPQWIYEAFPYRQPDGFPQYVARDLPSSEGNDAALIFGPYPRGAYTIQGTYYASAPALSATNTTNWMVENAPGMLHAACMVQAGLFIPDDKIIQRWQPLYQQRLKALVDADRAERWGGGPLVADLS